MVRLAASAIVVLLLSGCSSARGECSGQMGPEAVSGELGGDTALVIGGLIDTGRIARMVLDYGDGTLLVDTEIYLPAEQDPTAVPFGPGTPERPAAEGKVTRFRLSGPPGAPALRAGVMTVRLDSAESIAGDFDVQFEDDSRLRCNFDVTGKSVADGDQVPIELP
jgi:hypothetical protein